MRAQLDALAYAHTAFFNTDVAERLSKRPFGPALELCARQARGVGARWSTQSAARSTALKGDHVLLAQPFILRARQPEAIVERLGEALDAALASVR